MNTAALRMEGFVPYWRQVRRMLPRLLIVSSGVALVAYMIVQRVGPSYEVHFSYLISLSERENVPEYRFDGYYALQATDLFAATVAQWATTPEVIVAAHEAAQLQLRSSDPRVLSRVISTAKTAPQLVEVTVQDRQSERAEKLAAGFMAVMERNIERYHDEGIPALYFRVVATEPWVGVSRLSEPVIVSAAFVFTLLFGVNGVLLVESLRHAG